MKKIICSLFILGFFLLASNDGFATGAGPGKVGGGGPPKPPPRRPIPIDGGIGVLLTAAAAYGVKKLYRSNKNK